METRGAEFPCLLSAILIIMFCIQWLEFTVAILKEAAHEENLKLRMKRLNDEGKLKIPTVHVA